MEEYDHSLVYNMRELTRVLLSYFWEICSGFDGFETAAKNLPYLNLECDNMLTSDMEN